MLVLISGPYRSGTGDDPQKMQQNLDNMEAMALPLFRKGHVPVIGEWFAHPLLKLAGCQRPGDEIYEEISYPVAHRILQKCDAVLRIAGDSKGADIETEKAREMGLPIYYRLEDVPDVKVV